MGKAWIGVCEEGAAIGKLLREKRSMRRGLGDGKRRGHFQDRKVERLTGRKRIHSDAYGHETW